jgi:hypothetical protein
MTVRVGGDRGRVAGMKIIDSAAGLSLLVGFAAWAAWMATGDPTLEWVVRGCAAAFALACAATAGRSIAGKGRR